MGKRLTLPIAKMRAQTNRLLKIGVLLSCVLLAACSPASPSPTAKTLPTAAAQNIQSTQPTAMRTEIASSPSPAATASLTASLTAMITATIPEPAGYTWKAISSPINAPVDIKNAADGSGRLFVIEQPGRIRILKDNQLLENPFLDITDRVGSGGSEQGLLGLAFHPNFAQNGYLYVNYTDPDGNTHIARFTASGDQADAGSEKKLLFVQQPYPNHNGGALAFDPSGYLLIGLGDGGSGGDPNGNAQSGNSLLGKLLRMDVDQGEPYGIPADNPYANSGEVYREIWAGGLRNPWRFSFDSQTGDLWIGDVGQNKWEEIDFVAAGTPAGLNFGWNKMEARHPFSSSDQPEFTAPVAEYPHGAECSVTGGYVYRGEQLPEWQGVYLFGDYCSGKIWGLPSPPQGTEALLLFETGFRISSFGVDETGEMYVADYNGAIYQLQKK